ncbi:hypothetical protein BCR33DRAFT_718727 [Rhizoclosmatium globosum]|uniref:G-protein coupled receptors family 3 profile domain-containing protein n=1 Tax=Rhizoclosmatium globosum TaxID=329046 RepID=A0A1Y2C5H6_9FUNG|nr:hypothetical protein BCR33DRAFT_718727 [Rhizoclosmatium globosum]|eukprot:ORY41565.1 hypothetical protein BCR33DRAFT_718727 [Rhizoclosmatium globosum]
MTLGTVPSYVANMTYIGPPSVSSCQARMWLQLIAFVLVTGASLVKNARVCLIYSSAVRLPPYFVRDALWFTVVTILLAIELFFLGLWHTLSNPTVIRKQLPGYVYQYTCEYTSSRGSALGTTLWVYNILLLAFIPLVTYFARNLGPTHSEFTFLLVLSLSATVSAILLVILHQPDDLIRSEMNEATIIFINTSIPLLMQSTPRIWDLFLTRDRFPVATTSATSSQNQTKSKRGSMMQPLLGSFHRTSFMKGRDSVSIVRTSMTAGVVKENPKFSILYDVVYLLNMVRSTSVWTKGVVAVGYMRGKVYLLFLPYKTNLMGASTAVTIHASTDSTPESRIKVIKGRNGQQDRLEVTTKQGPVVIDFEKAGSGDEVKQIIIGFIKK